MHFIDTLSLRLGPDPRYAAPAPGPLDWTEHLHHRSPPGSLPPPQAPSQRPGLVAVYG